MNVLAVVPTYVSASSDVGLVAETLETLRETAPEVEILVVDDGSPAQELVDQIELLIPRLHFELRRKAENSGFARTVNVGLARARDEGKDAVLVNADMSFTQREWLDRMLAQDRSDGQGPAEVVGARLLYPNGLIQHAGVYFSLLTRDFNHIFRFGPGDLPEAQVARRCPVTAALQLIRHEVLTTVGLYDEEFQMGWEDVDFCLRVFEAGGECVYQAAATAVHHESMFRGRPSRKVQDWQRRSWIHLMKKTAGKNFTEFVPSVI